MVCLCLVPVVLVRVPRCSTVRVCVGRCGVSVCMVPVVLVRVPRCSTACV